MSAATGQAEQPQASGAVLSIDRLVVGHARGPAVLHGISLEVRPGEIVALMGRNGAGKTTLLRAISGLLAWRSGGVTLDGRSLRERSPHQVALRGVAHVPEGRRVIPSMTVRDNLLLGGYSLTNRGDLQQRCEEIYEQFPALKNWQQRAAGTLSGGEQQMLSVARALMARPSVVLLDEPLTGLAPIFRKQVLQTLLEIRSSGVAVLLVEQNVIESLEVADRALILHEGHITLEGTADELKHDETVRESYLGIALAV